MNMSSMLLDFYKLDEQPFGVTADPRFLYLARNHREALASLFFAIENGLGFSTLIAEPGLGKTTLLFRVLESLRSTALTAFLFETQCGSGGLLRYLLSEFDLQTDERDTAGLHEQLEQLLVKASGEGKRVVVIIDEAQNLERPALETIRLLSNLETRRAKLVHVILSGQPQLAERLAKPDMAQFEQRISMTSWLRPLTEEETARYIHHRLRVAGHRDDPLFSEEATCSIAAQSKGVPRKINRLCFNALSLGYVLGKRHISKELIEEAGSEMGMHLLALQQHSETSFGECQGRKTTESTFPQNHSFVQQSTGRTSWECSQQQSPQPVSVTTPTGKPHRGWRRPWSVAATEKIADSGNSASHMLRKILLLIFLGLLPLDGQDVPRTEQPLPPSKPQFATRNPRYQIRPSDTIEIFFYPTLEFNQTVSVEPDGYITLREAGDLHVAGKSVPELREAITKAYAKILNEPVVTIVLKDFQKPHFIVGGQVGHPGKYELRATTTASEGVAIAGGLTERAKHSQVLLFRRISDDWSEVKELDLKRIYKGKWQEDIHLRPGDMLFVPQNKLSKVKPFLPNWSVGTYMGPGVF